MMALYAMGQRKSLNFDGRCNRKKLNYNNEKNFKNGENDKEIISVVYTAIGSPSP